ncbi:hypothetical protein [Mesotoga prima]|uniref:hypothetical protein n=1 Tax=Mesotoga prima TaxID=1184387 RepID=UPI002FD94610
MKSPKNYLDVFKDDSPEDIIELMRIARNKQKDNKYSIPYHATDIVSWDEKGYISPLFIEAFCKAVKKHPFYKIIKNAPILDPRSSVIIEYLGCSNADIKACRKIDIFGGVHTLVMNKEQILVYDALGYTISETYKFNHKQAVKNKLFAQILLGTVKMEIAMIPNECFTRMPFGRIETLKECSFSSSIPLFNESIAELQKEYHEVLLIDIKDIL